MDVHLGLRLGVIDAAWAESMRKQLPAAEYIRHDRTRRCAEERQPDGLACFTFEPGQQGFAGTEHDHRLPNGRPERYFERGGDWRGNPAIAIKRINAAVVLNNQSVTDAKGVTTSVALTEAQLEKMTALVRETVGFNQDRGDSVNVVNAPFAPEKAEVNDTPAWRQPEVQELARSLAWPLGTLGLAALVLLGVIRPAMKALTQPAPAAEPLQGNDLAQLDAIENDQPERPQLTGPSATTEAQPASPGELRLEDARKLTRDNPAAVANIVKAWMNGEAPA